MSATILTGDVLDILPTIHDASVDAVLCDPPYGLSDHRHADVVACLTAWLAGQPYRHSKPGFMGKEWDRFVPGPECWRETLRVLRPGGYALVFAGTRSIDLMTMALRLAGYEIRDCIRSMSGADHYPSWCNASGFPKGLDVSKALDEAAGAKREVVGESHRHGGGSPKSGSMSGPLGTANVLPLTAPATDDANVWNGYRTALKPAWEPVIVAQKPIDGTFARNAVKHGAGGLNIDGCRIPGTPQTFCNGTGRNGGQLGGGGKTSHMRREWVPTTDGRYPTNVIHDGSDEVLGEFAAFGEKRAPQSYVRGADTPNHVYGAGAGKKRSGEVAPNYGDTGTAARFFYAARASGNDRWLFCRVCGTAHPRREAEAHQHGLTDGKHIVQHPTVKPTSLTEYLARLIIPPAGIGRPRRILVPFAGSGSEMVGALRAGWDEVIGIEMDPEYAEIARARVGAELPGVEIAA